MRNITEERIVYKPFEYPEAFDFYLKQQQAHWIWTEVPMMADVTDWKQNPKTPKPQRSENKQIDQFKIIF